MNVVSYDETFLCQGQSSVECPYKNLISILMQAAFGYVFVSFSNRKNRFAVSFKLRLLHWDHAHQNEWTICCGLG